MKNYAENPEESCRSGRQPAGNAFHRLGAFRTLTVVMLSGLLLVPPEAQAVRQRPIPAPVFLPPFVPPVIAQPFLQEVTPFSIVGFIQNATLDPLCTAHPFCGGTATVNGITIVIPQNTIFQFPASAMTWDDMFANAPAAYKALGQSGLAMSDTPKPLTTYEANITGNRVINAGGDSYIAGLVYLSQSGAVTQGFINFINYTTGDIYIGKPLGSGPSGTRVRLNSPAGVYGNPDPNPNADQRIGADEENPTMMSVTGYPMCLPRIDPKLGNDPVCPAWNRPRDAMTGAFSTQFTMQSAPAGAPDANGITHQVGFPNPAVKPDPYEQVPFQIGDYVTFMGTLTQDAAGVYTSAHTINASIAVFTAPGTWPVYAQLVEFSMLVGGTPNPLFPIEGAEKLVVEAVTTDPTQLLDVYSIDVNPCTGALSHRFYGSMDPFGPPIGGVRGRGRIRTTIGNFLPPTRELRVASRSLTHGAPIDSVLPTARVSANGITAGQYLAPQFDFIFPEQLVFGAPQVPNMFEVFPFLVNGSGPYARFADGVVFNPPAAAGGAGGLGQLKPWPSFSALPTACGIGRDLIQPPVSNAGPPQAVPSGATVTLSAALSADTNTPRLPLFYTWLQTGGPAVALSNPSLVSTTFKAPTLAAGAAPLALTFQMVACNGYTCGGVSTVNVTVSSAVTAPVVTLTVAPGQNVVPGTRVTLTGTATGAGTLTQVFAQTAGPTQTLTRTATTAAFTATLPAGTVLPAILTFTDTVTSTAGGSSKATISVFVGADTINVSVVSYTLKGSTLAVSASTNALPKGSAVLTVTALGANGLPIGADVVMHYDPLADTYNMSNIVNPAPFSIRIRSNFGGTKVSPLLTII